MTSPQFRKTASRKMGGAVFGVVVVPVGFVAFRVGVGEVTWLRCASRLPPGTVDLELGNQNHSAAGRASASPVSETSGLLSRAAESVASAASRFGEAVEFNDFEQKLADCWDNNSDGAVSLKSFWFGPHNRASLFNKLPPPEEAIQIGIDIAPQEEAVKLWKAVGDLVKSFNFRRLQSTVEGRLSFAGRRPRDGVRRSEVERRYRGERGRLLPLSSDTWIRTRGPLAEKQLLPQNIRQSREGTRVYYRARSYNDIKWYAILEDRPDTDREAAVKIGVGPGGMLVDDVNEDSSNGTSTARKRISWTVDYESPPHRTDDYNISCRSTWEWSFLVDVVESAPRLLRVDIKELDFELFEIERQSPLQDLEVEHHCAGLVPLRSLSLF
eukprot:GSA120T00014951001.1